MCSNEQTKRARKGQDEHKFTLKISYFFYKMHCQSCLRIFIIRRHSQSVFIDLARHGYNDRSRTLHAMECTPLVSVVGWYLNRWQVLHIREARLRAEHCVTNATSANRGLINHTTHSRIFLYFYFFAHFPDFFNMY